MTSFKLVKDIPNKFGTHPNYQCISCHLKPLTKKFKLQRKIWKTCYSRAKSAGIEHTITPADIPLPEICKYLGIRLDYRNSSCRGSLLPDNTPSIDRIDNSRGYVPGNVQVISYLANRMKSNASISQLIAFAEGVIRVHGNK